MQDGGKGGGCFVESFISTTFDNSYPVELIPCPNR